MGGFIGSGASGYWGYAPLSGVSVSGATAAMGRSRSALSDGQVVIVRPRTVNVNLY